MFLLALALVGCLAEPLPRLGCVPTYAAEDCADDVGRCFVCASGGAEAVTYECEDGTVIGAHVDAGGAVALAEHCLGLED